MAHLQIGKCSLRRRPLFSVAAVALGAVFSLAGEHTGVQPDVQRDGWSFDRASLVWNDEHDAAGRQSGPLLASGYVDYDFKIAHGGWQALLFQGANDDWPRDILVDGKSVFRESISTEADRLGEGGWSKEGNLFLTAGDHTLRIRRTAAPSRFPGRWALVPADGRPSMSVSVAGIESPIIAPGRSFKFELMAGRPGGPIHLNMRLRSLVDDSEHAVGAFDFPASPTPVMQSISIDNVAPGAYVLVGDVDGELLRPNDLKAGPLVVSAAESPAPPKPVPNDRLRVCGLFASGMVVQRDAPIPVWGWAPPGKPVQATFGDESQDAISDGSGRWKLQF
jgi:hypothetical protein